MLGILSKQKNYPPLAIGIALAVSFIFTVIIPHEWADAPQAQAYMSVISRYVPAMVELKKLLPPENSYIALTGAAIWGISPLYFLMSLLIPFWDKRFIETTHQYVKELNLQNKNIFFSFLLLILIDVIFFNFSFFTVWRPSHHYGFGSWMNMVSPNALIQLITWTFIGLAEFLFIWVSVGIFLIIKCKIEAEANAK